MYDVETRLLLAREHTETLKTPVAEPRHAADPARRWLAARLIAAGRRVEPDCRPRPAIRAS